MALGPALDRLIGAVSPQRALARQRARIELDLRENHHHGRDDRTRRYDAAGHGPRTSKWHATGASAAAEVQGGLELLRARSRELVRNNEYASKAIASIDSRMVGEGIKPQARVDGDPSHPAALAANDLWSEWAESTDIDPEGQHNVYGLQSLVARTVAEGGDGLARRRVRSRFDNLAVPLQIQLLEGDHLDSTHDSASMLGRGGGRRLQGVEFDALGRRRSFRLYRTHPGDALAASLDSADVPASEVLHLFRAERIGQVRGVPWLAPCMIRMRDFDETVDARVIGQKIANMFSAFVYDSDPAGSAEGLPNPNGFPIEDLVPGTVEHLEPGREIKFSSPPSVSGFREFADVTLHGIAAGAQVPYEELTGDLSRVSFISGRMGMLDYQARVRAWRAKFFIPQFCAPLWRWFVAVAQLSGQLDPNVRVRASWTCSSWPMLDPAREVGAKERRVIGGFASLSEIIREEGGVPREVFAELASDLEALEALGLSGLTTLPKAPGKVAVSSGKKTRADALDQVRGDGSRFLG